MDLEKVQFGLGDWYACGPIVRDLHVGSSDRSSALNAASLRACARLGRGVVEEVDDFR